MNNLISLERPYNLMDDLMKHLEEPYYVGLLSAADEKDYCKTRLCPLLQPQRKSENVYDLENCGKGGVTPPFK